MLQQRGLCTTLLYKYTVCFTSHYPPVQIHGMHHISLSTTVWLAGMVLVQVGVWSREIHSNGHYNSGPVSKTCIPGGMLKTLGDVDKLFKPKLRSKHCSACSHLAKTKPTPGPLELQ